MLKSHQSISIPDLECIGTPGWATFLRSIFVRDITYCLSTFYLLFYYYVFDNCVVYFVSDHIVITLAIRVPLEAVLTNWSVFWLTTVQQYMVNTTSAGFSEGQATSLTIKTEFGSHDNGLQPYMPKTLLEKNQSQQTNDIPENAAQDDVSQNGHNDTLNSSWLGNQLVIDGLLTAQEEQDK